MKRGREQPTFSARVLAVWRVWWRVWAASDRARILNKNRARRVSFSCRYRYN